MKRRSLGVARRRTVEISLHPSPSQICQRETQGVPSSVVKRNTSTSTRRCSESNTDVCTTPEGTTSSCTVDEDCSPNSHKPLPKLDQEQSMLTFQQSLTYRPRTFRCRTSQLDDGTDTERTKPSAESAVPLLDGPSKSGVSPSAEDADKFSDHKSTPIHKRYSSRQSLGGSARKRFRHDFKSPMRNQESKPAETAESLQKEIELLQQTSKELETEITSLINEGYSEDELQTHIEKMHEYNELKDTGQMLLGKIALVEGVTTKDLYERFGLSISD